MVDETTTSKRRGRKPKEVMPSAEELMAIQEAEEAIEVEIQAAEEALKAAEDKKRQTFNDLATAITSKYQERAARRANKDEGFLKSEALYLGSLSVGDYNRLGESPFQNYTKKKRPDRNIVWTRCEIAKAQLVSMQFSGDEKNWELVPAHNTPNNPAYAEATSKMEAVIADQLEECNYKREVCQAIHDMVVLGTGILKGPVNTGKVRKKYVPMQDEMGRVSWVPSMVPEAVPEIKRVNPWLAYPDDSVTSLKDIGDFIELHPSSKADLLARRKSPAFAQFADAIDEALKMGPNAQLGDSFQDSTNLTSTNPSPYRNKYLLLEYHGPITRTQLETLEIDPPYDVPGDEYFGEVWVVNNTVIRIELENIEGCGHPPYSGDVWQPDPASPFGFGLAEKLGDSQRVVTQAWHMILDNGSASSAPQVVINEEMVDPRNGEYELKPGKIWYSNEISGDVSKAFQFFEVPNVTQDLFPIMQAATSSAEEESGFSLSIGGLQSPRVGSDSATGLSIQERAANVLLDQKSDSLDSCMIEPRLRAMYDWNMQYNPDDTIKQDMTVRIKSSTDFRNKQMYIRDMEKISVEASNPNSELGKHVELNNLTRARLSMMSLPTQNLVKPLEQVLQEEQERQQNQQPSPDMIKLQIDSRRLDIEERRLALEEQKLAFELQQNQQREMWEHEERMANTYARISEAQASVLKEQNVKETAMLNLAARMENDKERNRITASIAVMGDETKRWLEAMRATTKAKDQLLQENEQNIKLATGSGY